MHTGSKMQRWGYFLKLFWKPLMIVPVRLACMKEVRMKSRLGLEKNEVLSGYSVSFHQED